MTSNQYIALTLPLCTLLLAGGFAACARWQRAQHDLQWMAAGFVLFSVGVASQIVRVPYALDDSAVVSAALYHLCAACIGQAVVLRHGVRAHGWPGALIAVVAWLVLAYYAYADNNLHARIYVLNFGLGAQLATTTARIWRSAPGHVLDRGLRWLFGIFVLSFFVRTVLTIPQQQGLTESNFGQTPFWIILYLSLLVFAVLFALLYLAVAVRDAIGQLQHERNRDPLTQLLNRRALQESLSATSAPLSAALVLCDVDHFKSINDRWGHAVGDAVLQHVAQVLQRGVRPGDLVGRYGGEEFLLVLHGLNPEQAACVAQRLQAALQATAAVQLEEPVFVSMSCGVAALHDVQGLDAALIQADQLLYAAKASGRNCVRWKDETVQSVQQNVEAAQSCA